MLKKLKTLSVALTVVLVAGLVDAQKVGNGGNFGTSEARRIFSKIVMFLDYSLYSESSGIDSDSIRNANEIYDLNAQVYPSIGDRLYVLGTAQGGNEVCVVGSTQVIGSILVETNNAKVVQFFGQSLVRLDRYLINLDKMTPEQRDAAVKERASVVAELQRGQKDALIGANCIIKKEV